MIFFFGAFQGCRWSAKKDIISGAAKLSEYLNREPAVVVELNSYAANSSEQFSQCFAGGVEKECLVLLRRSILLYS